jgi:hypothetical protein
MLLRLSPLGLCIRMGLRAFGFRSRLQEVGVAVVELLNKAMLEREGIIPHRER